MKRKLFILFAVLPLFLSACYINEEVSTFEVGVKTNGGRIIECVTPGVHTEMGLFQDLVHVNRGTVTFSVTDPEVLTKDDQPVGVTITIQARRSASCEDVKALLTDWPALVDDQAFIDVISATARENIKIGTRQFTFIELQNDRNGLSTSIRTALVTDSSKYAGQIVNVTVENIDINDLYADKLNERALIDADTENERRRQALINQTANNKLLEAERNTDVLEERLKQEQAQTAVEVEIASREGEVIAEKNAIYSLNAEAFELERLRLLKDVVGEGTVYFMPDGADLTMFFNPQSAQVVPVTVSPEAPSDAGE